MQYLLAVLPYYCECSVFAPLSNSHFHAMGLRRHRASKKQSMNQCSPPVSSSPGWVGLSIMSIIYVYHIVKVYLWEGSTGCKGKGVATCKTERCRS